MPVKQKQNAANDFASNGHTAERLTSIKELVFSVRNLVTL